MRTPWTPFKLVNCSVRAFCLLLPLVLSAFNERTERTPGAMPQVAMVLLKSVRECLTIEQKLALILEVEEGGRRKS